MKIELNEKNESEDRSLKYPSLMRNPSSGIVWLALEEESGVVIYDPCGYADIGSFVHKQLIPFSDPTWEPLPLGSTVTFTQE